MGFFKELDASTGNVSAESESVRLVFIPARIKSNYNNEYFDNNEYFANIVWIDPARTDLTQDGIVHLGGPYKLRDLENGSSEGRWSAPARLADMHRLVEFEDWPYTSSKCLETIQLSILSFSKCRSERSSNGSTRLLSSFFGGASAQLAPLDTLYWIAEWTKWLAEGGERGNPSGDLFDMVVRGAGDTRMKINALRMSVRMTTLLGIDKKAAW
ncbi:uncharacterized protein STEHIDRAFT_162745 [Stereum hirsutum FP-91666 SS1]|uniref:Uncharacterized protein n=1 Tax=Stereum hirsutum (strain FP-91666) TaxID=721885 RepID=R7RZH9_STEHR|nr:uncharacterized protein STEHIDRAFT_162745 [Stereum hirsutum FP-91666 SS1]EIM80325.1 hypothetical protein STEHIDRAFT_162745 [Stereum hirsutum FP-91666 SS1]